MLKRSFEDTRMTQFNTVLSKIFFLLIRAIDFFKQLWVILEFVIKKMSDKIQN